jgi:regulatory protein
MAGRRRGRTGRGWDAAPPRADADASDTSTGRRQGRWGRAGGPARADGAAREDEATVNPAELAREICLRQLAVRPRTRTELATALRRRGIDPEVAAEVLDRYGEVGIVDDRAFASAWVSSRHHGKGLARRALAGELRRKGVEADVVDQALEELPGETEAETARALVARKLRTERPGRPDATFRRLVGVLARKGYPAGLAVAVVKDAMADWSAGHDDLAGSWDVDAVEAEIAAAEADEDVAAE